MAVVRFETLVAPELSATCAVRADPSTEAVAVVREITLNASRTVFSFGVRGVADHADDGDRPLRASVGPCRSADRNFAFDDAVVVASASNVHVDFPRVLDVRPSAFFSLSWSMPTANAEDPCRSEGT